MLVSALELLICIVSLESIHREPTGAHKSTKGGWIDRVRLNCTRGDWDGGGGVGVRERIGDCKPKMYK